jgi:putative endonuclease
MPHKSYAVYILASHSRRLYVGVTGDLQRRLWQHRSGVGSGFTKRYHIVYLVYYEQTSNSRAAIAREKQIKSWTREKRVRLIESQNAGWLDLAAGWFPKPRPGSLRPFGPSG